MNQEQNQQPNETKENSIDNNDQSQQQNKEEAKAPKSAATSGENADALVQGQYLENEERGGDAADPELLKK